MDAITVPIDQTPAREAPSLDAATAELQWPPVPLGGVTELRVHGVGGTPPTEMLDVVDPIQVSGDQVAGFWRRRQDAGAATHRAEAYSWGGLNGRGFAGALWLLALPFALVNLAGWMAPVKGRAGFRGAVRLAGLCVTALYVLGSVTVATDLVAYQCAGGSELGRSGRCAAQSWWLIGAGQPMSAVQHRVLLGALAPVVVVVLLLAVTFRSRKAYEGWDAADDGSVDSPAAVGLTHPGFWRGQAYASMLAEVHVATGFTCVAVVLARSASVLTTAGWATALVWLGAAGLAGCALLTGVTRYREALPRRLLVAWSLLLLIGAMVASVWPTRVITPAERPQTLPGLGQVLNVVNGLLVVAGAWLLLSGIAGQLGRHRHRAALLRRAFTPFAVVTVGSVLLLTVQAGTTLWLAQRLGSTAVAIDGSAPAAARPDMVIGQRYPLYAIVLFPALLVVVLVAGLSAWRSARGPLAQDPAFDRLVGAWGPSRRLPSGWADGWPNPVTQSGLRRALRRPRRMLAAADWVVWTAGALAVPVIAVYVVLWLRAAASGDWPDGHVVIPEMARVPPWEGISLWLLTALPVAAVFVLRQALTKPGVRRMAATAWDVATFWPRSFHPLAPPSYAERAVPELQGRLERLFAGDGEDTRGAVLLLGHSQGSILTTAALAGYLSRTPQVGEVAIGHRLALITYGCPLTRLYARNFPAYIDDALIADLRRLLADDDPTGEPGAPPAPGWRNFWRDTDPIGGLPLDLVAVDGSPHERYLPDPPAPWYPRGDARQPVRGHAESGYRMQGPFVEHVHTELDRLGRHLASAHRTLTPPPRDPADHQGEVSASPG